jgi:tetratricopeptide (TPR) repeat protein
LQELGRYPEAMKYYKRVLLTEYGDVDEMAPTGSDLNVASPRTASIGGGAQAHATKIPLVSANLYSTVWYNLGLVQDKLGLYEAAIRSFQMSLKLRQEMLGPHHPDVACLLYNIGVLQMEQQQLTEASISLHATLRICQTKDANQLNDMHIIKALERLASLYEVQGDFGQAIAILHEVVSIQETSSELDVITRSKKMGMTLRTISEMLLSTNELSSAVEAAAKSIHCHRYVIHREEPHSRDSLDKILDRLFNVEQLVSSMLLLGSLYHEMCEPIQADIVFQEAAMTTRTTMNTFNRSVPSSLLVLVEVTAMLAGGCGAPQA